MDVNAPKLTFYAQQPWQVTNGPLPACLHSPEDAQLLSTLGGRHSSGAAVEGQKKKTPS